MCAARLPSAGEVDYGNGYDLTTGQLLPAYAPVLFATQTRPARSNIEVATLPALGWLIEIEVIAAMPKDRASWNH